MKPRILAVARRTTWKRLAWFAALIFAEIQLSAIFNLDPLSGALGIIGQLVYLVFLMLSNFALFFGPFLLFARMGIDVSEPGDASWEVKVSDVRGQKGAVSEMGKILKLIEEGRKFVQAGGTREKGVLMVGPPGVGKTMLAKAIATELEIPMISANGASFAQMFMGMDALKVLMLMRTARKQAKRWGGAIVFIDEIDALGQRRSGGMMPAGGMFMGNGMMALNMMLVKMDGLDNPGWVKKTLRKQANNLLAAFFVNYQIPPLKPVKYNIFFMGATNRPQVLDEALTRPGRFGRQLMFKMPDLNDRIDILDLYLARVKHEPIDAMEVARIMDGYSPAQIQQALSVALMYAFEHGRQSFNRDDLREAMGNVEAGMAEPITYSEEDALAVARHEVGHAVANRLFVPGHTSVRLSIKKRAGMLGHHRSSEIKETFILMGGKAEGLIKTSLGSHAAEREFYQANTSGVSADLKHATSIATQMAADWGMSAGSCLQVIGGFDEEDQLGVSLISHAFEEKDPIALKLADEGVRKRVSVILARNYCEVAHAISVNRDAIDAMARELIMRQELQGEEIEELFTRYPVSIDGETIH